MQFVNNRQQIVGSHVKAILTRQTCSQRSSTAAAGLLEANAERYKIMFLSKSACVGNIKMQRKLRYRSLRFLGTCVTAAQCQIPTRILSAGETRFFPQNLPLRSDPPRQGPLMMQLSICGGEATNIR